MSKNNYRTKKKVGDYIVYCQRCGNPCWASEATVLGKYTGAEGLIVCPDDVDKIDYGLVPYKIRPEVNPKRVSTNHYVDNPNGVPNRYTIDLTTTDPMTISNPAQGLGQAWEELNAQNWEDWDLPWGQ
jgi:hypothetical protein